MSSPRISPLLNLKSFASAGTALVGVWPEVEVVGRPQPFERLASDACEPGGLSRVEWNIQGEQRAGVDGDPVFWLHLSANGKTKLICQRCLAPAEVRLEAMRTFRFVRDEETAALEDDVSEEDVLVQADPFDWVQLLEDELIMASPLVPMHEVCPQAPVLRDPLSQNEEVADRIRPFADLGRRLGKAMP